MKYVFLISQMLSNFSEAKVMSLICLICLTNNLKH